MRGLWLIFIFASASFTNSLAFITTPPALPPNFTTPPPSTPNTTPPPSTTPPPPTTTTPPPSSPTTPPPSTPTNATPPSNVTTPPPSASSPNTTPPPPPATPPNNSTITPPTNTITLPSTVPPPASSTTKPPLVCSNGGRPENGFCICPDEWSGETCAQANFCSKRTLSGFHFPQTVIGWFGYSKEKCQQGTTNGGISMASARCLDGSAPRFGPPQVLKCDLTLNGIYVNISTMTDLQQIQELAASTQILTSRPEKLTAENITAAAQIANRLLQVPTVTEETAAAVVATVSQLLNASLEQFSEQSPDGGVATERLTETLQKFSLNQDNNVSLVVQPNLAVLSAKVPPRGLTEGVQFMALSGISDNFTANRIQLDTNTSQMPADDGRPSDVQIFIKFAPGQSHQNANVSIGFVLYENDLFFRSRAFSTPLGTRRRVISANLRGGNVTDYVEFRIRPGNISTPSTSLYDFTCVFWDYSLGDWSTKGCSKINSSLNLRCLCNHTTNFAVLMSFRTNYQYSFTLNWISIVGSSLSTAGLSITIIFQIMTRKSRKSSPTLLLVSICVSMIFFYLVFIFGINNKQPLTSERKEENVIPPSDFHQERDSGPCTAVAALLQYFLLATFTWNSLYAAHVFLLMKYTISGPPQWLITFSIVTGWGLPAIIVAISLAATYRVDDPLGYRQEEFCWLASLDQQGNFDIKKPMLFGILLPQGIMIIFNTLVLLYFAVTTCRTNPELTSNSQTSLRKKFLSSFSLGVVLGLSWVLGYMVLITRDKRLYQILSIAFCVCNTTQGLQIFILFTARTSIFRKKVADILRSVPTPEIALHKKKFSLWRQKGGEENESYRQIVTDFSS